MTFGSLFAGIGGMDLGLERAGMTCRWQVEIDPWCQRVLAKHWPHVSRFGDIKTVGGDDLERVDLIAGGFPCQPVSITGRRRGRNDSRWLWPEFFRLVREVRPRYVLVENTTGLLTLGMGDLLRDLATLGFDAEWSVLSACAVGAPHPRERVFLVANSECSRGIGRRLPPQPPAGATAPSSRSGAPEVRAWSPQSGVRGVAHGVPHRVDRLRGLGNAVVPQVVEWIGRRILAQEVSP